MSSMVLCDTNVFIHFFSGDTRTQAVLSQQITLDKILIPDIVGMELMRGCQNRPELLRLKKHLFSQHLIVETNEASARLAFSWIESYHLSHGLSIPDALIAGIAVARELPLFTYNLKDFAFISGLRLYTPNSG